jgi:hypothetical protein
MYAKACYSYGFAGNGHKGVIKGGEGSERLAENTIWSMEAFTEEHFES